MILRRSAENLPRSVKVIRRTAPSCKVLHHPSQLAAYDCDALSFKHFTPEAVVIPENVDQLVAVVKGLAGAGIPFQPRGAGTSLSGGPVAAQGGVILHLSRFRTIEQIDKENRLAVVQPGVVLSDLEKAVKPLGLYYPPDPSTGPVCTLGGNVASNSGGVHCFRYGVTGNYVLGVETLLLDGSLVRFGGPAGGRGDWRDDWKRLFIGSEGTLGIFTRFWLRLIPRPEKVWTLRATYRDLRSASLAIQKLATHPSFPAAIEFMDPRCVELVENSSMRVGLPKGSFMILTEIDGPAVLVDRRLKSIADLLQQCGSEDVAFADVESERLALWKARKALGGLLGKITPNFLVQDAVIPKAVLGEMLEFLYQEADAAGVGVATIMHAGDGNLHPNFLFDARRPGELEKVEKIGSKIMLKVSELGGTLSGEHGIGNDKSPYIEDHFGPLASAMQMAIPNVFNPQHQLNPLKVFPQRKFVA